MNVIGVGTVLQKLQFFTRKNAVDLSIKAKLEEREQIEQEISIQAKKIVKLKQEYDHQLELDEDLYNPARMEIVHFKLETAERVFFTLFNRLRILHDLEPLKGVKFTGDFKYESFIQN